MRRTIESLPHSHREMRTGTFLGITDRGLPFNLEVVRETRDLTTNEYARKMMDLRVRVAAERRAAGLPLGVDHGVSRLAVEDLGRITFVMNPGKREQRIEVRINPDGSYSALSWRRTSLRETVRGIVASLEARPGARGMAQARLGM